MVVGIDNLSTCIVGQAQREAHYARIGRLLDGVIAAVARGEEAEDVARVRRVMRSRCLGQASADALAAAGKAPCGDDVGAQPFDVGREGSLQMQIGLLQGASRFSEMTTEMVHRLVGLVASANQGMGPCEIWNQAVEALSPGFFDGVIDEFRKRQGGIREALSKHEDVRMYSNSSMWHAWKKEINDLLVVLQDESSLSSG